MDTSRLKEPLVPAMPTWTQQRAAGKLDRLMRDEEICPHGVLPSERTLSAMLGVSRQTLRVVLRELKLHGRIGLAAAGSNRLVARPGIANAGREITSQHIAVGAMEDGTYSVGHRAVGVVWSNNCSIREAAAEKYSSTGSWSQVRFGIADSLQSQGRSVLLLQPDDLCGNAGEWLADQRLDGLIVGTEISPGAREAIINASRQGQHAVVGDDAAWAINADRVVSDHREGTRQLTEFLIQHGRRRILRVWTRAAQSLDRPSWLMQRDRGYEQAISAAGLEAMSPVDHPQAHDLYERAEDWFEISKHIYAGYLAKVFAVNPPDAIMAATDTHIPALIAACRLLGKRVHEDIAVVGYDHCWGDARDREFERTPPLATIDKHNHMIGEAMVDMLLARLAGNLPASPQLRLMGTSLVVTGKGKSS